MTLECLFHADDFGLNVASCEAILQALEKGRLQSLSLMPTGQEQGYNQVLLEYPKAQLSVHLNLLEGRALTNEGHGIGLTTKDGFFHLSLFKLLFILSYSPQKKNIKEWIYQEFCAQIRVIKQQFPDKPIRLDGHLHIHLLPPLHDVMKRIFQEFPIEYVRTPIELAYTEPSTCSDKAKGYLRRNLLSYWARPIKKILLQQNIKTSNYFIGSTASCALNAQHIENALDAITKQNINAHGLVEIMMHPVTQKVEDLTFYKDSQYCKAHLTAERVDELDFLLSDDFTEVLNQTHVKLATL